MGYPKNIWSSLEAFGYTRAFDPRPISAFHVSIVAQTQDKILFFIFSRRTGYPLETERGPPPADKSRIPRKNGAHPVAGHQPCADYFRAATKPVSH